MMVNMDDHNLRAQQQDDSQDPAQVNTNQQKQTDRAASQVKQQPADQVDQEKKSVSGLGKEQKESWGSGFAKEAEPHFVEKKEFEPPAEVEDWVEKLEEGEEITLPGPVKDDYGNVLMEAADLGKPQIFLPLEKEEIEDGLTHKVADSIRWLSEWCVRVIKMFPSRTNYKTE
jgi:hypothetical protein